MGDREKKEERPMESAHRRWWENKWFLPGFSVFLGVGMWIAFAGGGHPGQGAFSFGVMLACGALFLFGGRSEMIRGMRGDGRDERWAMIDLRATAIAGMAVITALIAAFFVEVAHGNDPAPYSWLGGIGGVAYLAAFLVGRWRS
jgi:hypothetical protein